MTAAKPTAIDACSENSVTDRAAPRPHTEINGRDQHQPFAKTPRRDTWRNTRHIQEKWHSATCLLEPSPSQDPMHLSSVQPSMKAAGDNGGGDPGDSTNHSGRCNRLNGGSDQTRKECGEQDLGLRVHSNPYSTLGALRQNRLLHGGFAIAYRTAAAASERNNREDSPATIMPVLKNPDSSISAGAFSLPMMCK